MKSKISKIPKNFSPNDFFDLRSVYFSFIFENKKNVWEAIYEIQKYIKLQFDSGKIIGNYPKAQNVYIGEGTIVQEGAYITGPAIIGKNCFIGHGSLLRENCLFGDNVHIGHVVEVKNSIFLNSSIAAHFNYVGDSIIGNNVNISGGTILANLRLDRKKVFIRLGKEKIDTGLDKFGCAVGDNSNIGVNCVLNPGTLLERGCVVYPLKSITGYYVENSVIK